MHSLTMADDLRSFQFLDIYQTQQTSHYHLEYSYGMMLMSCTRRKNKQF